MQKRKKVRIKNGVTYNGRYCFASPYNEREKEEDIRVSYMSEAFNKLGWENLDLLCRKFPYFFSFSSTKKYKNKHFKISEKFRSPKELQYVLLRINRLDIFKDINEKYFSNHLTLNSEAPILKEDLTEKLIMSDINKKFEVRDGTITFESSTSEREKVPEFERQINPDSNKIFPVDESTSNHLINEFEMSPQRNVEALGVIQPTRTQRSIVEVGRNQTLSQRLKNLYKHHCQICGEKVQVGVNEYTSESHHIQPVGGEHRGPDIAENLIIVCPNHHLMFDRGAITIELKQKKVIHVDANNPIHDTFLILKHHIQEKYIQYHNKYIFKGMVEDTSLSQALPEKRTTNYGKTVTVCDTDGEQYVFQLETFFNKHLLGEIEKLLIAVNINDEINFNGFRYRIISIK